MTTSSPRCGASSKSAEEHPLNIAYLITRAEPIGGAQIHVRDLAVALRTRGHSPTVVTGGTGSFVDSLRDQGVPVMILNHLAVPIRPLQDVRAFREIRFALQTLRPDLVTTHSSKAGILGRMAARSLGIPVVFTAHGWAFTPGIPSSQATVYRRIERLAGPLSSRIITVSEFDRNLALAARIASSDRLVTVHNGIPDIAPEARSEPGREPVRLVMIARFEPQKDHATLFRALAGLKEKPWTLDLVGNGPLMGDMQALASELEIGSHIRFLGQRMDVDQLLGEAQVSLLVTNWEGFPLSVLESMRAGLPVIASDVGGINEAIQEGTTGYLVPRGDVIHLRERISQLLADAELRQCLGSNGRNRFLENFTLSEAVSKTVAVYRSILNAS
jgi:glycosyltransferase involved in cell wall biosynthesis